MILFYRFRYLAKYFSFFNVSYLFMIYLESNLIAKYSGAYQMNQTGTKPITLSGLKKRYKIIEEHKTSGSSRSVFYIIEPLNKPKDRTASKEIIKIMINEPYKIAINEINVNRTLSELHLPFFPKFIESGTIILPDATFSSPYFISEYIKGVPLIQAFTNKSLKKKYQSYHKMILFQILYSIYGVLVKNIYFRHNDLHPNNILISSTESFDNEVIEVGNILYCLSGPIIKIIDFGRSSIEKLNDNSDQKYRNMTRVLLKFINEQMNESNIIKYSKKLRNVNSDIRFWVYMKLALSKKFANLNSNEPSNLPDWTICRQIEKCLNHPYFDSLKCGTIQHVIIKN